MATIHIIMIYLAIIITLFFLAVVAISLMQISEELRHFRVSVRSDFEEYKKTWK